jgi:hypothetical protein
VKHGNALLPLLFNLNLEYVTGKVLENQVRLKLNGTNHLLAHADDVNQLGDNIDTTRRKFSDTIKEVGPEVSTEKSKHMLLSLSPHCRAKSWHRDSKQIV